MHACFIVLQLRSDSCQIHGYVMLCVNFIFAGEIRNHTNKQKHTQTITDISTPCLSACVDNKALYVCSVPSSTTVQITWMQIKVPSTA